MTLLGGIQKFKMDNDGTPIPIFPQHADKKPPSPYVKLTTEVPDW
jgi:hypothetical protein